MFSVVNRREYNGFARFRNRFVAPGGNSHVASKNHQVSAGAASTVTAVRAAQTIALHKKLVNPVAPGRQRGPVWVA